VPLSAFDVVRLCDALGVPWQQLATLNVAFSGGFRLDLGPTRWGFRLRQRSSGSCVLTIGDEFLRCAAHASRPAACRLYPFYVGLRDEGVRVVLGGDAVCPPSLGAEWAALAAPALVEAEIAEHARHQSLIEAWDASLAQKREADDFLRFAREAM
jgi:Fe-S-cluster containining protein